MRDRLFLGLALALLAFTLALPLFPAGDGGVHVYYAQVLRALWRHEPWAANHFYIHHTLPPYAFHSYVLAGLLTILPSLWSEKVLLAGYVLAFVFGFRYLVRSVNPRPALPIEFAAFPLVWNVLARAGFYNCSLGIAAALFGWGYWLRQSGQWTWRSASIALATTLLVASMHPIALAGLLLVFGCDTLLRLIRWRTAPTPFPIGPFALTAAASLSLLWVLAYVAPSPNGPTPAPLDLPLKLILFFGMWLFPAEATPLGFLPYLLVVYPLAFLAIARRSAWQHPLTLAAAILFVVQLVAPFGTSLNGSLFLAHRFALLSVLALLPLAARSESQSRWPTVLLALAILVSGAQAAAMWQTAEDWRSLAEVDLPAGLVVGAVVEDNPTPTPGSLLPPPYWYAGHLFGRNHAYLYNAPWLNQTFHIPGVVHPGPCQYLDPSFTLTCLKAHPQPIDFLVHYSPAAATLPEWASRLGYSRTIARGPHWAIYGR